VLRRLCSEDSTNLGDVRQAAETSALVEPELGGELGALGEAELLGRAVLGGWVVSGSGVGGAGSGTCGHGVHVERGVWQSCPP
jgi:hypothetical protein